MTFKRNSKLFLVLFLGTLSAFGPFVTDLYLPALPTMTSFFNASTSTIQLTLTGSMVGLALGQLLIGPVSDKYGRKNPLIISLVIYLISTLFEFIEKIVVLSQMTGTYLYIYNQNDFDLIPNLPFDISEKAEDNLREKYRTPEIKALIRKLRYYHHVNERKKIIEKKLSERPNYDVSNGIYKRNIFYHSDNSLWGDIDHIYEIKSKEVVKDLEFIYSKLNEKIESIHMLNYIFSYKENKIYREILGIQKNEIFGKYYLESGIQYFKVVVKRNEKMKEIINKIEKYKEL